MLHRQAAAEWTGDLKGGQGKIKLGSGTFLGPFSFRSRHSSGCGTNPEELVAAAYSGCYSLTLTAALGEKGHPPRRICTAARAYLVECPGGFEIPAVDLEAEVQGVDLDDRSFQAIAEAAKRCCPMAKLLRGAEVHLTARLVH